MTSLVRAIAVLAACSVAALCLGCSRGPSALEPEFEDVAGAALLGDGRDLTGSSQTGFIPLEIGNVWRYQGRVVEGSFFDDGPAYQTEREYVMNSELVCLEERDDRSYVVARELVGLDDIVYVQWLRLRQTSMGLFEADVWPGLAPECAPEVGAGARPEAEAHVFAQPQRQAAYERARAKLMEKLDLVRRAIEAGRRPPASSGGEITRLGYPLYVGARWQIRSDPLFTSRVVAHERVRVPAGHLAGYKVQIQSELFAPRDRVYFWVSRKGFLKYAYDLRGPVVDVEGNVIGEVTFFERRELTGLEIRRPVPYAAPTTSARDTSLTTR